METDRCAYLQMPHFVHAFLASVITVTFGSPSCACLASWTETVDPVSRPSRCRLRSTCTFAHCDAPAFNLYLVARACSGSRRGIKNLLLVPPLAMVVVAAWSTMALPALFHLHVLWPLLRSVPVLGGWDEDWGDFVEDGNNQPAESWPENTWQPSSGTSSSCPSSTMSPWPHPSSCTLSPPTHDANYIMYMANIWDEFEEAKQQPLPNPNTESSTGTCQWDEEVCHAEQLEEFDLGEDLRASSALPAWHTPEWQATMVHGDDENTDTGPLASPDETNGKQTETWLRDLCDTRPLRGQGRDPRWTAPICSSSSSLTWLEHREGASWSLHSKPRTSTASLSTNTSPQEWMTPETATCPSSASSSSTCAPLPLSGSDSSPMEPTSPSECLPEHGITQRGNKIRAGIDRWHHPNGSIRVRRRERLEAEARGERLHNLQQPIPEESEVTFQVVGQTSLNGENVVQAVTFYGEPFTVWGESGPTQAAVAGAPSSLGNNDDPQLVTDAAVATADTESSQESSEDMPNQTVGFWRNGEWVPRPRTASERRQQRGGNGPQRAQRKQARLDRYFRGEWLPAWLEQYKADKAQRSVALASIESEPQDCLSQLSQQELSSGAASSNAATSPVPESALPPTWGDTSWSQTSSWSSSSSSWSWWDGCHQWDDWGTTESWTWSSSSSTTSTLKPVPQGSLPTWPHSCYPSSSTTATLSTSLDNEFDEDIHSFMQLRNSERARMQEAGVPASIIQRLETFLQQLDDRQELYGTGAEGRWAIQCMLRRAQEAEEALGSLLDVLADRLEPQGFWPIRRVPRTEGHRWVTFNWGRQLVPILVDCLQAHLDTRLQAEEAALSPVVAPPEAVATSSHHSTTPADTVSSGSSNGQGAYSRRRRSDTVTSLASRAPDSQNGEALETTARHADNGVVSVARRRRRCRASSSGGSPLHEPDVFMSDSASEPAAGGVVRGPPVPLPVSAALAPTELQGIWREPDVDAELEESATGPVAPPASSSHDGPSTNPMPSLSVPSTVTSTAASLPSLTTTSSLTTSVLRMRSSAPTTSFSTSSSRCPSLSSTTSVPGMGSSTPSASSCTTSSFSTSLSSIGSPTSHTTSASSSSWSSTWTLSTTSALTTPERLVSMHAEYSDGLEIEEVMFSGIELVQITITWDVFCTSTSTSTTLVSQDDQVRDAVNRCALLCGRADLHDLLRRLQDRQRRLSHLQRLTNVALEELCTWFSSPAHALPLNAGEAEEEIWGEISRHASAGGFGVPASSPNLVVSRPTIMVGPDMPSAGQIAQALPGRSQTQLASMRRRLWRRHVHDLWPESHAVDRGDEVLYLVQTFADEELQVPDPGLLPERPHAARLLHGQAARRRHHRPRPAPRLEERREHSEEDIEDWVTNSDVDLLEPGDAHPSMPASSSGSRPGATAEEEVVMLSDEPAHVLADTHSMNETGPTDSERTSEPGL